MGPETIPHQEPPVVNFQAECNVDGKIIPITYWSPAEAPHDALCNRLFTTVGRDTLQIPPGSHNISEGLTKFSLAITALGVVVMAVRKIRSAHQN